jgi:formyl-CoA transferase
MHAAEVVASRIFTVADIEADAVYREREDIVEVQDVELGAVRMQGVIPKLNRHQGSAWRTGPRLGQDNELVYREWLRMDEREYAGLVRERVIRP